MQSATVLPTISYSAKGIIIITYLDKLVRFLTTYSKIDEGISWAGAKMFKSFESERHKVDFKWIASLLS